MRKIIKLIIISLMCSSLAYAAPITKTLDKDTNLHPQGWPSGVITFKDGTSVSLNDNGEVISGTLKKEEPLILVGSAYFEAYSDPVLNGKDIKRISLIGTVTFNDKGEAVSGELALPAWFNLIKDNEDYPIKFDENTMIYLSPDGSVAQGTIAQSTLLRPVGWKKYLPIDDNAGFILFQSDTEIIMGADVQVLKGTIANKLTVAGVTFPAGTTLQFSETSTPQVVK